MGGKNPVEVVKNLVAGLATGPGQLGCADDLESLGVNQVQVTDQVGRPDAFLGDRDVTIQPAAQVRELQPLAVGVKQPRDVRSPHRNPTR